ncbi:MAG: hypothetical protein EHM49_00490 [Deltaproteobacteria bacterium]|nr:MAG: hypothetical protein EHM49_00490 [Deltaproteobacteria bacterium]
MTQTPGKLPPPLSAELSTNMVNSPEKIALYTDFIKMFNSTLSSRNSKKDLKELTTKMLDISLRMLVIAPDPVAKRYTFWKGITSNINQTPRITAVEEEKLLEALGNLLLEMRKDITGEGTVITSDDILGIFIKDVL